MHVVNVEYKKVKSALSQMLTWSRKNHVWEGYQSAIKEVKVGRCRLNPG